MCRVLAYLGPPRTLEELLVAPGHSLVRQSWAPRHQGHGTVNADGFGAAWYDRGRRPEPARYRRAVPVWADPSFASLAGVVASTAVLGAVRDATPPNPVEESGTPPFTAGPWAFAHNGAVEGFPTESGPGLRRLISDRRSAGVVGSADSELLFALALDHLDAGAGPARALAEVVAAVDALGGGRLNLVLTDGSRVAATAWGDTLVMIRGAGLAGPGVVVASEPCDDHPAWKVVPDRSVVEATAESATVTPL
ncbi:MAG: ergothioneine biosynthesis protein EgtC [Acidimicrobiales bacterium]